MGSYSKDWLPHLKDSVPKDVQGLKVTSYSIALEGWRRGLILKYYNRRRNPLRIRYSLSDGEKEIIFAGSRGSPVSNEAVKICIDKYLTKKYLKEANVPTPEGALFNSEHSKDEILSYAKELGYPLVVKPVDGSGGKGVIANIRTDQELLDALSIVRDDMKFEKIIVEEYFEGTDYRIYVIGDKVVAAFDRIPANVIGDGKNTIAKLLELKIEERQKNPALYNRPITVDQEVHNVLRSKGYDLNSVPPKGERVFLKTKNNVSSGGDSRDVTDDLTDEIKDIAVRATQAIPGLLQAGLDVMVNKEKNKAMVIEINARPSIRNHLYPMIGKARDIPKEIVDFYFPNTKNKRINSNNVLFYFELKAINDIFRKGLTKEITVPKIPEGDLKASKFSIQEVRFTTELKKVIENEVKLNNLHGYMNVIEQKDKMDIVVAGNILNLEKFKKALDSYLKKTNKNINITEKEYSSPIKLGFEIKRNFSSRVKKSDSDTEKLQTRTPNNILSRIIERLNNIIRKKN